MKSAEIKLEKKMAQVLALQEISNLDESLYQYSLLNQAHTIADGSKQILQAKMYIHNAKACQIIRFGTRITELYEVIYEITKNESFKDSSLNTNAQLIKFYGFRSRVSILSKENFLNSILENISPIAYFLNLLESDSGVEEINAISDFFKKRINGMTKSQDILRREIGVLLNRIGYLDAMDLASESIFSEWYLFKNRLSKLTDLEFFFY